MFPVDLPFLRYVENPSEPSGGSDEPAPPQDPAPAPSEPPSPVPDPPKPDPAPAPAPAGDGDRIARLEGMVENLTESITGILDKLAPKSGESAPQSLPWTHRGGRHNANDD